MPFFGAKRKISGPENGKRNALIRERLMKLWLNHAGFSTAECTARGLPKISSKRRRTKEAS